MKTDFLQDLNCAQRRAVEHPSDTPLQILAGPGSGKTKVLTSRIAHLILHHDMLPSSICAVTFTNKAANEMRDRLSKLIGVDRMKQLRMGTFHALCAMFLRRYASVVGLGNNFSVCDAEESKKLISRILKPYRSFLEARDITLKEGTVLSMISKYKCKGRSAADVLADLRTMAMAKEDKENIKSQIKSSNEIDTVVAELYREYERSLHKSNSLDFDDLLLYGLQLFMQHHEAVSWCRHVLVDEFQDTNSVQYELMKAIAIAANDSVTVVGDPDQSIYGWRSADITNLARMRKDFPRTESILLEQNYRSTALILKASLAIVAQDKARLPKSLHTSHPNGSTPSLVAFASEQDEATFIANEIKRLVANMGGVLKWKDFAVLLRFNALSRAIENALQKSSIPCRILGGHRFFERMEIKDILAYLQLVDNPQFTPAFNRVINVPPRGVGEKTLNELAARAEKTQKSLLDVVELIHTSKFPDIKPPIKRKIPSFVQAIQTLRKLADNNTSPVDLIRRLVDLIGYEEHLKHTQPDWESRWENVQELITFASEFDEDSAATDSYSTEGADASKSDTPLRLFLQASMLSSEGDHTNTEDTNDKVTISTCHAAKGLEWPVVMVPAVENGTFPFYRCDDVEEERRLLYVACTRAQSLLYLSYCAKRMVSGETKTTELSSFVSCLCQQDQTVFSDRAPDLHPADRAVIAKVLRRPEPEQAEVVRRIAEFNRTIRYRPHESSTMEATPTFTWHPSLTNYTAGVMPSSKALLDNNGSTSKTQFHQLPIPMPMGRGKPGARMLPTKTFYPQRQTVTDGSPNANTLPTTAPPPTAEASVLPTSPPSAIGLGVGVKRRLGMGRSTPGYANKKFKPPT